MQVTMPMPALQEEWRQACARGSSGCVSRLDCMKVSEFTLDRVRSISLSYILSLSLSWAFSHSPSHLLPLCCCMTEIVDSTPQIAVQRQLEHLLAENPDNRAILITFNNKVTFFGDGTGACVTLADGAPVRL
jgi:hypothetical protein